MMMAPVLGFLPAMWERGIEIQASGFGLALVGIWEVDQQMKDPYLSVFVFLLSFLEGPRV